MQPGKTLPYLVNDEPYYKSYVSLGWKLGSLKAKQDILVNAYN